jgi:Flp pilus assembly protein TadB
MTANPSDWYRAVRERVESATVGSDRLAEVVRAAFEAEGRGSPFERMAIAGVGLSAAVVAVAVALTSLMGLALAAVVLYVVLTRVFGLDLRLDPESLFAGFRPTGANPR